MTVFDDLRYTFGLPVVGYAVATNYDAVKTQREVTGSKIKRGDWLTWTDARPCVMFMRLERVKGGASKRERTQT